MTWSGLRSIPNKVTNITSFSTGALSPTRHWGFLPRQVPAPGKGRGPESAEQGLLTQAALDLSKDSTRQAGSRRQVNDAVNSAPPARPPRTWRRRG